jgi:hypothetical protein
MATPTKKNPEIDRFIQSSASTGMSRQQAIENNLCLWCGKIAEEFRDDLSKKEYTISGMCQPCQDETFGR